MQAQEADAPRQVYEFKSDKLNLFTLPNAITMTRILMVPVMVFCMLQKPHNYIIITYSAFCYAGLAGLFDGFLARRAHMLTVAGQLLDTFITKLTAICGLLLLSNAKVVPPYVVLLLIAYNIYSMTVRSMAHERGMLLPNNPLAQAKTVLIYVGIALIYVSQQLSSSAVQVVGTVFVVAGIALAWLVAGMQTKTLFATLRRREQL